MKHFELGNNHTSWFRMDNSAAIYPMLITLKTQSLFRLGIEFNNFIDKDDLQLALEKTLKRYPSYKVELRQGFFRHYFIANHRKPVIKLDDGSLLSKIDFRQNNGYLLRTTYYKRKIFVDFFHALCDGKAGMEFMKTLAYYYLAEIGENIDTQNKIKIFEGKIPHNEEFQDGFKDNYKKFNLVEGAKKMAGKNAFPIKNKFFKRQGYGLIEGKMDTKKLLELSKKYNCSLTVFLGAIAILSTAEIYVKNIDKRDLVLFIPINLRKFYPSETVYNFTTFAKCRIKTTDEKNLQNYIEIIKKQLSDQLSKEELDLKVGMTSLMDENKFLKFLPLFLKSFITRIGSNISGSSRQTMILSNLGNMDTPHEFKNHIKSFMFNLNSGKKTPKNIAMVSYNNETVISFTRQIISTEIEKEFFRTLSSLGMDIKIASNLREIEYEMS